MSNTNKCPLRTILLCAFIWGCAAVAASTQDQQPTAPVPKAVEKLAPYAWMIGQWVGEGSYEGQKFTEKVSYNWEFDKCFIKNETASFFGDIAVWRATAMMAYDADKDAITIVVFGQGGALGRVDMKAGAKPNTWVGEGQNSGDVPHKRFRIVTTKDNDDAYSVLIEPLEGSAVGTMTVRYARSTKKIDAPASKEATPAGK